MPAVLQRAEDLVTEVQDLNRRLGMSQALGNRAGEDAQEAQAQLRHALQVRADHAVHVQSKIAKKHHAIACRNWPCLWCNLLGC